ncbi:hypothetical protein [Streptomyces sp. NPDC093060]|uniref:hypothetical protein n=1 Tax=Streptomyces sp. NPDC093060 TaxID=3366019 RepID=UPI003804B44E
MSVLGALGAAPFLLILGPQWIRAQAPAEPTTSSGIERPDLSEPSAGELAERSEPNTDRIGYPTHLDDRTTLP